MAALNSGSLNYLKLEENGRWAWPPLLFENTVEKVQRFLDVMNAHAIVPECECFDTGILRSVALYVKNGMIKGPPNVSLVMGVQSGMPARRHPQPSSGAGHSVVATNRPLQTTVAKSARPTIGTGSNRR